MQQTFQKIGQELFTNYFQVLVKINTSDFNSLKSRSFYSNEEINVMGKDLKADSLEYELVFENKFDNDNELIVSQCSNLLVYGRLKK